RAEPDQMQPERLDERALADAGDAAHADAHRGAGVRQEDLEQALRLFLMVRPRALDEGDRLRERAAVAGADLGRERLDRNGPARRRSRHPPRPPPPRASAPAP